MIGESRCAPISVCVSDGMYELRKVPEYPGNLTGIGQMMSILLAKMGSDFDNGVQDTYLVLDRGGCCQKRVEEDARNSSKSPPTSGPKPAPFVEGDLGHRDPKYFPGLFGDRSINGGRDQIKSVLYDLFNQVASTQLRPQEQELFNLLVKKCSPGCVFGVAGIGPKPHRHGQLISVAVVGDSRRIEVQRDKPTHHLEDTGIIYTALVRGVHRGKATLIRGADTDLWLIALLMCEKTNFDALLFVERGDDKVLCCNEAVAVIQKHPDLQHIPARERTATLVFITQFLGGDVTHSIRGISQKRGMDVALRFLKWIGRLLRIDSDGTVEVDATSYLKLTKAMYAERDPSITETQNYPRLSVQEKMRALDRISYTDLERRMAGKHVPDVTKYMASERNLQEALHRCQLRLQTWYDTDLAQARARSLRGFSVHLKNEDGTVAILTEAVQSELDPSKVVTVRPTFDKDKDGHDHNRSAEFYFGDRSGPSGTVFASAVRRANRAMSRPQTRCATCFHIYHADPECECCGGQCIARCKRCLHPPHAGSVCSVCKSVLGKSRAHCVDHCAACGHIGAHKEHSECGCSGCGEGGCQLLAAVTRAAAAAALAESADGQFGMGDINAAAVADGDDRGAGCGDTEAAAESESESDDEGAFGVLAALEGAHVEAALREVAGIDSDGIEIIFDLESDVG